jgi:hypothetical protein
MKRADIQAMGYYGMKLFRSNHFKRREPCINILPSISLGLLSPTTRFPPHCYWKNTRQDHKKAVLPDTVMRAPFCFCSGKAKEQDLEKIAHYAELTWTMDNDGEKTPDPK